MDETQVNQPSHPDGPDGPVRTSGRGPLTWLVAALAVVVILVVSAIALLGGDDAEVPLADETGVASQEGDEDADDQPSVTRLETAEETGRCMLPTAEALAEQPLALEGTVVGVEDGVAVLDPEEFFAGRATDRVEVVAPTESDRALLGSVELEEGSRYLVAAADGRVVGCGLSGPAEPELAELYAEAFHR
ncbi:hypothetical protein I601_0525 [Nocardioides dokdonensis FR1436]|uniref:Uncharacterized protein n=1 Tax=Nocardioides dokdonensis FR1436 TaxID=1300347 RepID=A0A1A9GFA4_9ACTN|nr:hypothetical protein [Nocardioides dokdonensis]ANH36977.1 hypothetical protein I601_0525 [Nocardioides dokdonensis FR1436]